MTETRRVETIQIKLTPAEKRYIQKSAGSQSVSTFVREQLMGKGVGLDPAERTNQREAETPNTPNKGTPQKSKNSISESPRPAPRAKPNFRDI